MYIDFSVLSASKIYHTMTQAIIPRPIAWVLSENSDGNFNLAPFSYFSAVSSEPPLVMLSIGCKPCGEPKDTRENIVARKHFVIHIPGSQHAEKVTASSATLAAGHSELDLVGMDVTDMPGSPLPRLQDCALALSCELYRSELVTPKQMMVLGKVNGIYVDDACANVDEKGRVNISAARLDPLARLGSNDYAKLGQQITIARPK